MKTKVTFSTLEGFQFLSIMIWWSKSIWSFTFHSEDNTSSKWWQLKPLDVDISSFDLAKFGKSFFWFIESESSLIPKVYDFLLVPAQLSERKAFSFLSASLFNRKRLEEVFICQKQIIFRRFQNLTLSLLLQTDIVW